MPLKRTGLQTIDLPLRPAVCASAAFVGKKEGEGPLGNLFDHVAQDELYGQDTFELAENASTWTPSAKPSRREG